MGRTGSWKDRLGPDKLILDPDEAVRDGHLHRTARKLARLLLAMTVVMVVFCAVFPFDFLVRRDPLRSIYWRFDTSLNQLATAGDSFQNILFFVPFGFALGGVMRRRLRNPYATAAMATLVGTMLSLSVELGQCFLWWRDPSLADVLNNSIGTLAGFGLYRLFGARVLNLVGSLIDQVQRKTGAPVLGTLTALYAAAVCVAPLRVGGRSGDLGVWSPGFALAVGNEIGADRTWHGTISELHLVAHEATEEQVASLFDGVSPQSLFGDAAVVGSYALVGEPPFEDAAGRLGPLDWDERVAARTPLARSILDAAGKPQSARAATQPTTTGTTKPTAPASVPSSAPARPKEPLAVRGSEGRWLRTGESVSPFSRAVATSGQFTVITTIASARRDQYMQARIATISAGAGRRNFTLGQDGTNLIVRARTSVTGENGNAPQFIVNDVFTDTRPHKVVVTFAGGLLRVYVDNRLYRNVVHLTPEAAAVWNLYPRDNWDCRLQGEESSVYSIVYRAMTFMPLGALAAATANLIRRPFNERTMIAFAVVLGTAVVLEGLMTAFGGQPFQALAVLVSVASGSLGIAAVKIRREGAW